MKESRRDLDFLSLLRSNSPFKTIGHGPAALFLCGLALLFCGSLSAQNPFDTSGAGQTTTTTTTNPSVDQMQSFCNQPTSVTNPDCAVYNSQYGQPGQSTRETDISPPYNQQQRVTSQQQQGRTQQQLRQALLPSPQPTEFQRVVQQSIGRMLPVFGESIFRNPPSTFAPVDNIPVTPDYVIGPGDEIRLQVWGQVNQRGTFIVDRTGSISLPQVGPVHVAGLQFSQLTDFLRSQYSRVYRNFDLNVNMGQLRSIQVFVVGKARQPGSYTVSSLSTLLNALFASGGPLPEGSLRDVQLKRGGQLITHFDLYDLLLRGDKSKDVQLASGDVIFIPSAGPQVAVAGSVNTPAIYELRDEKTFQQVIELAGGLTNTASATQVHVDRIEKANNEAQRGELDVNLTTNENIPAHDGDIITVLSVIDRFKNAVTLRGNVADPGRYAWREGMRISDLIPSKDALVTRDYYQRLMRLGQNVPQYLGPQQGAAGNQFNTNCTINNPNCAPSYNPNYTSPSYPASYTGSGMQGAPSGVPGAAPDGYNAGQNTVDGYNQYNQYSQAGSGGGTVSVQTGRSGEAATNRSTITSGVGGSSVGAAITAGNPNFPPKTDVVLGGPDIDWSYAVIERQNSKDLTTSLLPFNLEKAVIAKDPSQNLQLLPGDIVNVFSKADIRVPSEQQTKFVRLEGEFAGAGVYSAEPGETLRHLVERAGGLTPEAYLFASDFTRENVRRLQRQRLLEFADQLDAQITSATSAATSGAITDRDTAAAQASAAASRAVVARLRQAQPTGRIVLQLKPDSKGVDAIPDIPLQDGDQFIVPRTPATVSVEGQVYNANAFIYQRGKRVKDYMRLAGGPDRTGDRRREFILRADGSVVSRQYGDLAHKALFANTNFDSVVLYPGDTIVVPPVIQKGALLRDLSNISTILGGLGLSAAAINAFI